MQGLAGCRALVAMWSVVRVSGGVLCVTVPSQRKNVGGQHRRWPRGEPSPARWGDAAGLP